MSASNGATPVAVLGSGSWGTALAVHLARQGRDTRLWFRRPEAAQEAETSRLNPYYLPGVQLPEMLTCTASFAKAVDGVEVILSAVPTHTLRGVLTTHRAHIPRHGALVSCAKGLEEGTHLRMTQVMHAALGSHCPPVACLSGPGFASGLAKGDPTAVVIASDEGYTVSRVMKAVSGGNLRCYANTDLAGVEMCGAVKNIIAIAAGVVAGLGFGPNTAAALITRGLNEMARFGETLNAKPSTFSGLAGLGDLVLTCTGEESRNRRLGKMLGQGKTLEDALKELGHVAEGVRTTRACLELAREFGIEMPITEQMEQVIFHGKSPREACADLLSRRLKFE